VLSGGKAWAVPAGAAVACLLSVLAFAASASGTTGPRCTIVGTAGPDSLRGQPGADVICGRGGDDRIYGGNGADRILGGAGADQLRGGAGNDALLGGRGTDRCRDSEDTIYTGCEKVPHSGDPRRASPAPSFFVPSSSQPQPPPDEEAPAAIYVSFQPGYVDTSGGEATVGLYVEAWDQSGIGAISVDVEGPDGPWRQLELSGGSTQWASAETSVDVPTSTPIGDYAIASLSIEDGQGNKRTLSAAEVEESAFRPGFVVFAGPDETGPELKGLSLSATTVDTGQAPATVKVGVSATDDLSGVGDAWASIVLPSWEPPGPQLTDWSVTEMPPTAGTRHDGVWEQDYKLVEHAMPGTYAIEAVYLSDMVGNKTIYHREELEELGYPVEFVQSGAGDTTPPELLGIFFEPPTLHTSAGARTIVFYLHVRDDLTGLGQWPDEGYSRADVSFEPPGEWHEFSSSGTGRRLVSGTELDGVWRQESILEPDAVPGLYKLSYAGISDRAGNELVIDRAELEDRGWPVSFLNEP